MARGTDISPLSLLLARLDAVADGARSPDTVPSGFPSLDKLLGGGLRRGDLIVLGGDYVTWGDRHFVTKASDSGSWWRQSDTGNGPPVPWYLSSPRCWFSAFLK